MANKKFHYSDKKSDPAASAPSDSQKRDGRQDQRRGDRRGGSRRPQKNGGAGKAARRAEIMEAVYAKYPAEKLGIPVSALGVSEELTGLLSLSGISTAGDLVSRTERDMFKVQGFNKKMLLALKRGLEKEGMAFYAEAPREQARPEPRESERKDRRSERGERGERGAAKRPQKEREERPKKLTEPLPVPEWRKIQKNGKWGFYDGFNTVIPAMYDEVFFFKDGLAAVELDEKCGYIDPENNVVIPFEYETAMSFSEGYASVVKGGKCGYIDKKNEVVIPFIYDAATPFEGGEGKVKKDGRWGTIFPDGTVKWI